MAEKSTIARPYAQAIFDLAQRQQRLSEWSDMLELIKSVANDERVSPLIGNPNVSKDSLASLMVDICADHIDQNGKNLVKLLVENNRLVYLSEMFDIFHELKAAAERVVEAEMVSAFPISDDQKNSVVVALKNKFQCEVTLGCETDEALIGGAIIKAGDMVIDGSITGQLERFTNVLSH